MTEILDKTKEWSERFGKILKASPTTRFSHLYKGAVGGLTHVISVDNAGSYMELWREGSEGEGNYYATTGAAIKPLPGLAKGARLDEALDRFFVLMAKKGMGAGGRAQAYQRPQRKAIPKKIKRLAGVRKQGTTSLDRPGQAHGTPRGAPGHSHFRPGAPKPYQHTHPTKGHEHTKVRKNIVEKVDPEIGPSMSVGHRKPSDLSPESSMRKSLARRIVKDASRLAKQGGTRQHYGGEPRSQTLTHPHFGHKGPEARTGAPHTHPQKPPVKKNVVALTGNQPGSGRVKPARTQVTDPMKPTKSPTPPKDYKSSQGFSGRRTGTPDAPGASHSGMVRRDAMGRKTSSRRSKPDFGRMESKDFPPTASRKEDVKEVGGAWRDKPRGPRRADSGMRIESKPNPGRMQSKHDTPQSPHKEHMGGGRPYRRQLSVPEKHQLRIARDTLRMPDAMVGVMGGPNKKQAEEIIQRIAHKYDLNLKGIMAAAAKPRRGRKTDNLEGGRTQPGGGTKPVRMPKGGPGQPSNYGSTGQPQYRYGRKACLCDEVAKTTKAVRGHEVDIGDRPAGAPGHSHKHRKGTRLTHAVKAVTR